MSPEVRIYLFTKTGFGPVEVAVFRSMTALIERWQDQRKVDDVVSGLVFAGSTRPTLDEADGILSWWPSFALVTDSARWLLPSSQSIIPRAVEGLVESASYPEMSVYIGHEGWGYNPDEAFEKVAAVCPPITLPVEPPQLSTRAALFQFDDVSTSEDPFLIAKHLPEWALGASIHALPLTVRCRNVIDDQGFATLSDLTLWSAERAKVWRNFGRQSMRDLADAIKRFVAGGPGQLAAREVLPATMDLPPLIKCVENALLTLSSRETSVLRSRWGLDGARKTLEMIATEMSVTRERIRQIEAKATKKLSSHNIWFTSTAERIRICLKNRDEPLYLHFLEIEDAWFEGFADKPALLSSLLSAFQGDDCHILDVNHRAIISRTSQDVWEATKTTIIETLKRRQGEQLDKATVRILIEANLPHSPELAGEMMEDLKDQLNFVFHQGSELLVAAGKKVVTAVASILEEAAEPLHYSEVWRLCEGRLGRPIQRQYVHNTLMSIDALYFDRGTYGTWKHFPLEENQQAFIVEAIDEIVQISEVSKQWHTEELLRLLDSEHEWLTRDLTRHLLDLLLRRSKTLKPVGRMVWIRRDTESAISSERIDISEACIRILEDFGRPMKAGEIRAILEESRGLGRHFQMHSSTEVTRTAPGLWGLVRRDFGIDAAAYQRLIEAAIAATTASGEMLDAVYLVETLREQSVAPSALSTFAVLSLLQTDRTLHVFRGQMVGLADWASTEEQQNDALVEMEEPIINPFS